MGDSLLVLELSPVQETDFSPFCRRVISGFADLLVPARKLLRDEALVEATDQIITLLNKGFLTPFQHFFHLRVPGTQEPIGIIWVHVHPIKGRAFLYWIEVFPQWRTKGYGRAGLVALEQWLKSKEIYLLNLEVFSGNEAALCLYHQSGFDQLGYVLQKKL